MNKQDFDKLLQIRKLLKEAYDHYFELSDGHSKSSEGSISIEFGDYWSDKECEGKITGVSIYSYVLGSSRLHYFEDLDKALETVVQWHKEEMAMTYDYGIQMINFEQFLNRADKIYYENEFELRYGQTIMNVLYQIWPDKYKEITNTDLDCFYDDGTVRFTLEYLKENWPE